MFVDSLGHAFFSCYSEKCGSGGAFLYLGKTTTRSKNNEMVVFSSSIFDCEHCTFNIFPHVVLKKDTEWVELSGKVLPYPPPQSPPPSSSSPLPCPKVGIGV